MKYKIVFLSPHIYPCNIGGMEIFNYYLIKSLSKFNFITLLTNCNEKRIENINYQEIKKGNIIIFYISIIIKLFKIKPYDYLIFPYTSNSPLIYPVLLVNCFLKNPYIIIIHGGGMYSWKPIYFQKKFFKGAYDVIAVSETIKLEYEKRTKRIVKLIPPLIPFKKSKESKENLKKLYNFKDNDLIIISIGSIKKIKGSDILLKAFLDLGNNYIKKKNLKLLFVGDGSLRVGLEKKVNLNKIEDNVKFLGKIPHEKVNEIYKIADMYIIPSLFEGTPLSLLEAMYNHLPIIGSDVKGINNIIMDNFNGLLFSANNSYDLKNKIEYLIENREIANKFGLDAKNSYKKKYNYEKMIKEYKKILEKG